jgi:hypothetical protein
MGLPTSDLCATRLPELCEAAGADLEGLIAALPTMAEYERLLSNIKELADATVSRASPASRKADSMLTKRGSGPWTDLLERDQAQSHSRVPAAGLVDQSPQQYGDYAPNEEDAAVYGVQALNADSSSSNNVIDVYTTTVPRRSRAQDGKDKLTSQQQAEQEAATREQASARSLLRELNQHLRLMRTAQGRGEERGDKSGDKSEGGAKKAASTEAGLATAWVLMERVRELVSIGLGDDEDDDGTAGLQMTTTLSAATDVFSVPSLDSEGQVSTGAGRKEAPLVQVGTLMLTEDEMHRTSAGHSAEQMSLQQAMRSALMSEVAQAQQGSGGGAGGFSAFAAALQGRRAETTFGDDDDDD